MSAAGYPVEIIGAKAGDTLTGDKGRQTATVDLSIDEADVDSYEGLLIPGGHSPDYLRAVLTAGPDGIPVAMPAPVQDSSMLRSLAQADCLLVREPFAPPAKAGPEKRASPKAER